MNELQQLKQQNAHLKQQLQDAAAVLTSCSKQVGLMLQEEIAEQLAKIQGTKFNPLDFDVRDRNGEQ